MHDRITPVVLTYNESQNIARTLDRLRWAREVVVVDSFSTDDTPAIVREFPNARLVQRAFDSFAAQWNHALSGLNAEWVLALDADYLLSQELVAELGQLRPPPEVSGYRVRFRYCVDGQPLRGSLYPPSTVLFRRECAQFAQDGHTQRVQLASGRVESLRAFIHHDDRKPFARWLNSQKRYATEEARKLASSDWSALGWPDRVRKVPFLSAPIVAAHCLFAKGCVLDGPPGYKYVGQRVIAELLISLKLIDQLRG